MTSTDSFTHLSSASLVVGDQLIRKTLCNILHLAEYELRCCFGLITEFQVKVHVFKHLVFRQWFSVFGGCASSGEGVMACRGESLEVGIVNVSVCYIHDCMQVLMHVYVCKGQSLMQVSSSISPHLMF